MKFENYAFVWEVLSFRVAHEVVQSTWLFT